MLNSSLILTAKSINTPLGLMHALADEHQLYLLAFVDQPNLNQKIEQLKTTIVKGTTPLLEQLNTELNDYFEGIRKQFTISLYLTGTHFQREVWNALLMIPYGQTRSYKQQANSINRSLAYRAVANAQGANPINIIVPCHRVINNNGQLGGYHGGEQRKRWLFNHERNTLNSNSSLKSS
jgi:AraC family transcriptional regulator of adaptative response/methylated-DNA-[protein]-cysteine methyltransferase